MCKCTVHTSLTGVPDVVPGLIVVPDSVIVDGGIVNLTLYWGEPFNNFDPITNYTVDCEGDASCDEPAVTTSSNMTQSFNFTNLSPTGSYIFKVFATNSLGNGMAATVMVNGLSGIVVWVYSVNCMLYTQKMHKNFILNFMCSAMHHLINSCITYIYLLIKNLLN